MSEDKKTVTMVVPVYNEEDNIEHFSNAVEEVMKKLPYDYKILFVNDGSKDRSAEILEKMSAEDVHIQAILLARNYGHQVALTCGLDNAEGDVVITMDGDMQHPPALIPTLLSKWEQGYDVVQTIRETTKGVSFFKKFTSKCYYKILNLLSDVPIHEGGSDFRLMDKRVVEAFRQYHEHDKFIRGLIGAIGYKQTLINFEAPERFAGVSKFSLHKMLHFALDGILAHSTTPLRMAFYIGLLSGLVSIVFFIHVIYETLLGNVVPGWATITVALSFFGGIQLVFLGVVGEYIARIFREVKNRPIYFIDKKYNFN